MGKISGRNTVIRCLGVDLGVSGFPFLRVPLPGNGYPPDNSFLRVFEHAGVLRHTFPFVLKQVAVGFRFPENEKPHQVPDS